jgi:hypothetical protein
MVDLRLSSLTVVKKADNVGRDEPMLWTMFIELSLDTLNSHQFVITTDPVVGKLGKAGKGDTLSIPAAVGRYHHDGGGVGLVGVAVAAFDNDLRTDAQIHAGYAAGAAALNQAIVDHFPVYGFAEVGDAEKADIQAKMRQAILAAFVAESVARTLLGGKALGGATYTKTVTGPNLDEPFTLSLHAKNDRAIYTVAGRLQKQA